MCEVSEQSCLIGLICLSWVLLEVQCKYVEVCVVGYGYEVVVRFVGLFVDSQDFFMIEQLIGFVFGCDWIYLCFILILLVKFGLGLKGIGVYWFCLNVGFWSWYGGYCVYY